MKKSNKKLSFENLEHRNMLAVNILIDYSYDRNNFFDTQEKRDTLQLAANDLASHLEDSLQSINPQRRNNWRQWFVDPATGDEVFVLNPKVASNQLVVYAGGRDLGASLGEGGPGGFTASGDKKWIKRVSTRGEGQDTPWGGSVSFNIDKPWNFAGNLTTSKFDFYSVALHELTHILGFGASAVFDEQVIDNLFAGPESVADYGEPVPLTPSWGHWDVPDTVMDKRLKSGTRETLTRLDLAALKDIGWEVTLPSLRTPRAAL